MTRPGMTLVELLVGITIAGLAISAGYGALAFVTRAGNRELLTSIAKQRDAAVRQSIEEWLSGARLEPETNGIPFQGVDGYAGDFADDEVTFLTTAPTPLDEPETIIRLRIDRDNATAETGLVAELAGRYGTRHARIEVLPEAAGLELRFLSGIPGDDRWLPSWISRTVLPRGIELTLQGATAEAVPAMLGFPIRAPLGANQ